MRVQEACIWDALAIGKLGTRYAEEACEYAGLDLDLECAIANVSIAIHSPNSLVVVLISDSNEIVGFLWGVCGKSLPWTHELIALDQIVYVLPEYRGSFGSVKLIKAYEAWALDQGASEVRLSVASGIHEDRTAGFYNKLGYTHLGSQQRRNLDVIRR